MASFDPTKSDNDFWTAFEYFGGVTDDDAGVHAIATKLSIDLSPAQTFSKRVEIIEKEGFNALKGMVGKVADVIVGGCRFSPRVNWSSASGQGWAKLVSGKPFFLTWREGDMSQTNYNRLEHFISSATRDAAELNRVLGELATLKKDGCEPGGGLYDKTRVGGTCNHKDAFAKKDKVIADRNKRIADLEAQLVQTTTVVNWTKAQQDEVAARYLKIEEGWACCYKTDGPKLAGLCAVYLQVLGMRGQEAFDAVIEVFDRHEDIWKGNAMHSKGVTDPSVCNNFDTNSWMLALTGVFDTYLNKIGGKTVNAVTASKDSWWRRNFAFGAEWWDAKKGSVSRVRNDKQEVASNQWIGRLFQNWKDVLIAPPRALARDDGTFGGMSYTFGVLGSIIMSPFVALGLVGNLPADALAKVVNGKTLTTSWSRNWFIPSAKA